MRSFMQEHLANLMIVHTFTEEENTVIEAEAYADRLVDRILHRGKFAVISNLCTYGMMRVDICWGGVILCGFQIIKGQMTYGTMAAILQLIIRIDTPVSEIFSSMFKCIGMFASAERLMEVEGYAWDYTAKPYTLEEVQHYYKDTFSAVGLRGAGFSYNDNLDHMVIKDLDIEIRHNHL